MTGRIVALSKFISRSFDRFHRFFNILKKEKGLEWTPKCVKELRELKEYLSSPLLLSKPELGKRLLIYLTILEVEISVILIR